MLDFLLFFILINDNSSTIITTDDKENVDSINCNYLKSPNMLLYFHSFKTNMKKYHAYLIILLLTIHL